MRIFKNQKSEHLRGSDRLKVALLMRAVTGKGSQATPPGSSSRTSGGLPGRGRITQGCPDRDRVRDAGGNAHVSDAEGNARPPGRPVPEGRRTAGPWPRAGPRRRSRGCPWPAPAPPAPSPAGREEERGAGGQGPCVGGDSAGPAPAHTATPSRDTRLSNHEWIPTTDCICQFWAATPAILSPRDRMTAVPPETAPPPPHVRGTQLEPQLGVTSHCRHHPLGEAVFSPRAQGGLSVCLWYSARTRRKERGHHRAAFRPQGPGAAITSFHAPPCFPHPHELFDL